MLEKYYNIEQIYHYAAVCTEDLINGSYNELTPTLNINNHNWLQILFLISCKE